MATNKIATNNDYTALWNQAYPNASTAQAATYAQTQSDVDNMTLRDRLWDAFKFAYGNQWRDFEEQSNNEISQQGRRDLSRGMQRSSYGAATEANMRNKQLQGLQDIYGQQIAAYEQALLNVEQQEREQENWQKEFDEQVRQFNIIHGIGTGGGGGGGGSSGSSGSGRKSTTQPKTTASNPSDVYDAVVKNNNFETAMALAGGYGTKYGSGYGVFDNTGKVSATTGRAAELNRRTSTTNMTR